MPVSAGRSTKPSAQHLKRAADRSFGWLTTGALKLLRLTDPHRLGRFCAWAMRRIGPLRREHKIARNNLAAAFPEKSPQEIEKILLGVWDNLGRVAAEFAHLDRFRVYDPARGGPWDIEYDEATYERFHRLRNDGRPALIFAAHLGNWELPALVAAAYKLDTTVLYRRPNMEAVAEAVIKIRAGSMGRLVPTGLDAPVKLLRILEAGGHVAMLVDQYNVQGVEVTFFGRRTKANPMLARLARHVECPIHGTRAVRLPNGRFRCELSEEISPARDAEGKIDVAGTMQVITDVVERWVREYPEQWLWVHRRWR